MITVPVWAVWVVGSYLALNAFSNALSMTDRDAYRFFVRFVRGLSLNFSMFAEKELGVQLPAVPTQADTTTSSAAPAQNQ